MWLKSVSKTVFFMVSLTTCIAFMTGKISEDNFMKLAMMAFVFFFSIKQVTKQEEKKP